MGIEAAGRKAAAGVGRVQGLRERCFPQQDEAPSSRILSAEQNQVINGRGHDIFGSAQHRRAGRSASKAAVSNNRTTCIEAMDTRALTTLIPRLLIRAYQLLTAGVAHRCRFAPSCSEYTLDALKMKGLLKGLGFGFLRVLKCHPWNSGGYDPIPF